MWFLNHLRKHATRRHVPELALPLELVGLPDLGQHGDGLIPHVARVSGVNTEAHLLVGVRPASSELDTSVRKLVDHCHTLRDPHWMRVWQNRHAKANPYVLGSLAEGPEDHFRTRRAGKAEQEVVLNEPYPVETDIVGQFALVEGLLV